MIRVSELKLPIEGNQKALEKKLADKRLYLSNAGNIAEAALQINDCFRSAQNAAEQYLNEIKAIREETEAQRQQILAQAQTEAETMIAGAKKVQGNYDSTADAMKQNHSDNG